MRRFGIALGSVASAVLVLLLLTAFVPQSVDDVVLYYSYTTVNPLFAGVFALGVILVFAAVRAERLSEPVGTGIALGLGLISLVIVTIWAVSGRVDVFLAAGWAFPLHRWVLVVVALLVVLGVALHAWRLDLVPRGT